MDPPHGAAAVIVLLLFSYWETTYIPKILFKLEKAISTNSIAQLREFNVATRKPAAALNRANESDVNVLFRWQYLWTHYIDTGNVREFQFI